MSIIAATIHKSQGVTVDRAHVLATPGMDRHSAYVALSRHRDGVQLHYGRDDFSDQRPLARTLSRERAKDMASDYPRDPEREARSFADRRGIEAGGAFTKSRGRTDDVGAKISSTGRGSPAASGRAITGEAQPRRGMFAGFKPQPIERAPSAEPVKIEQGTPARKRGVFDGLKLSAERPRPPEKGRDNAQDRDYGRAVERVARSANAIIWAQEKGAPVLEHQKAALSQARGALEEIRPGASRDMIAAAGRNPGLVSEAAAGRNGRMIDAMAQEARVRADPHLRADRFVERWQGLQRQRGVAESAGDRPGAEKAGKTLEGMAKGLKRDPQMESVLRNRTRELGLRMETERSRNLGHDLAQTLGRSRDHGLSR